MYSYCANNILKLYFWLIPITKKAYFAVNSKYTLSLLCYITF